MLLDRAKSLFQDLKTRAPLHLWVAAVAWTARAASIICQLVALRLLLGRLGENVFAGWALVTGLTGWFALLELGLGASVQNMLAERRTHFEKQMALVRYVFKKHALTGGFMLMVLLLTSSWLGPSLFRAVFASDAEKKASFIIGVWVAAMAVLGMVAQKVLYGTGEGVRAHIISIGASMASLLGVVGFVGFGGQGLLGALVAYFLPSALVWWMAYAACSRKEKEVASVPHRRLSSIELGILWTRARGFLIFAVLATAILNIDYLILSQAAGSREIVEYNLVTKVFSIIFFVYNALILALQPELTAARSQGRHLNLKRTLVPCIAAGFALVVGCGFILWWQGSLIFKLLGAPDGFSARPEFLGALVVYYGLRVWTDAFAAVLTAYSHLAPFWIWVPLQAMIGAGGQLVLVQYFGILGIVFGLILSFLFTVSVALPIAVIKLNKQSVII